MLSMNVRSINDTSTDKQVHGVDDYIDANPTGTGDLPITGPPASGLGSVSSGKVLIIHAGALTDGAHRVVFMPSGQTVDGGASVALTTANSSLRLTLVGSNWQSW